ncbi:translation initiation factor IF-3 [Monomorium pharaonis]|uniref:translation initiation factor IF-3 n=1 Tax=Monomorium pharaonis TaxID=307658 RepID=UPI00174780C5|nr:translation initiation factor IF-3 [Monomorium pharaonis]
MVVPELSPALRRAVHLVQSFSRCRVTRDTWRFSQCRAFSRKSEELNGDDAKKPRPKTEPVPRITLVSPDNSITVTVLEDAQRLAKRRNLTLVKITDLESKTQRPLYKLMNSTDVLEDTEKEEDTKDNNRTAEKSSKSTKLFYVSSKITEHDLQTKAKNVVKLLRKNHKIKLVITLDGVNEGKVQRVIEDAVKNNGSVQRMPSKKNVTLLVISPLHKIEDSSVDNKIETDSTSS